MRLVATSVVAITMPSESIVTDFPARFSAIPVVTAQRSTTLLAEINTLREMGHFEPYRRHLTPAGEPLLFAVAGTWIPMVELEAYYGACAALGLSVAEQVSFGSASARRCLGTLLGTAVTLAKGVGATPWTFFENIGRFWSRGYIGGGLRVVRLGPKDVRVDFAKNPLFARPFFRNGFRGYAIELLGLFCARIHVREHGEANGTITSFRGQWV